MVWNSIATIYNSSTDRTGPILEHFLGKFQHFEIQKKIFNTTAKNPLSCKKMLDIPL